jgi:hypothetical protein
VDTEEQALEAQLSTIAAEIIVAGEMQYREHLVWVYEDSLRRREEMLQADIRKKLEAEKAARERLIKLEADRSKRLIDSAENYRRAQDIRAFVSTVVMISTQNVEQGRVSRWRDWAPSPGRQARSHRDRADMGRLQRPRLKRGHA